MRQQRDPRATFLIEERARKLLRYMRKGLWPDRRNWKNYRKEQFKPVTA